MGHGIKKGDYIYDDSMALVRKTTIMDHSDLMTSVVTFHMDSLVLISWDFATVEYEGIYTVTIRISPSRRGFTVMVFNGI